jgi:AraC-like DNA-binding protein
MSGLEASLLLGGVHGILLAIVLRRRAQHRSANRYLAALLGATSLLLFDGFLRARGTLFEYPHLIGITAWVPFAIGPLVYLYVREMTSPDSTRLPSPWRHFIVPAAHVVLIAVTFLPRSAEYKRSVAENDASWLISALEVVLVIYGIAYAIAALVLLRRHRVNIQAIFSNLRGVNLRWLLVLAIMNVLVWAGAFASFVIRAVGLTDASAASAIVPLGSTITVFVIGYFQLGQAEIFVGQPAAEALPPAPIEAPAAPEPQPYARARLADDDASTLEARIKSAMTGQHLYQRAGLTLAELADAVAATPHEVSQVLSTRLGRNFYHFINEHRIEHVKAGLKASDRPVLDLAFEAGFQSKSTFNTAFRKATGLTPSEFRQRSTT